MQLLNYIKLSRFIQIKKDRHRNRAAFNCLRELGFSLPEIRAALIKVNNINVSALARGAEITAPTIHAVAYGTRRNAEGRKVLSGALYMDVKELFPDEEQEAANGN